MTSVAFFVKPCVDGCRLRRGCDTASVAACAAKTVALILHAVAGTVGCRVVLMPPRVRALVVEMQGGVEAVAAVWTIMPGGLATAVLTGDVAVLFDSFRVALATAR